MGFLWGLQEKTISYAMEIIQVVVLIQKCIMCYVKKCVCVSVGW